jgi:hypothetical protein
MTGSVSELPVGNRKTLSIFRTKIYMYVTNKLYIYLLIVIVTILIMNVVVR